MIDFNTYHKSIMCWFWHRERERYENREKWKGRKQLADKWSDPSRRGQSAMQQCNTMRSNAIECKTMQYIAFCVDEGGLSADYEGLIRRTQVNWSIKRSSRWGLQLAIRANTVGWINASLVCCTLKSQLKWCIIIHTMQNYFEKLKQLQ